MNDYVRCQYCDSAISIKDIKLEKTPQLKKIKHKRVKWHCPACGLINFGLIFKDED